MNFFLSTKGPNITVVEVLTDLDIDKIHDFQKAIDSAFQSKSSVIIVDLKEIRYICSQGLGVVANFYRRIDSSCTDRQLYLVNVSSKVQRLFSITCLDKFINIKFSLSELLVKYGS